MKQIDDLLMWRCMHRLLTLTLEVVRKKRNAKGLLNRAGNRWTQEAIALLVTSPRPSQSSTP
jgi:hypothetical protein